MSATFPFRDNFRIPPKPHVTRPVAPKIAPSLPWQVAASAITGFGLAWLLTRFLVG